MKHLIAMLGLLLLADSAWGASWENCVSGNAQATIRQRGSLCVDLTSGDLDSDILVVERCANIDIRYDADVAGSGATTTCQIRGCVSTTASSNSCEPIEGATLTGSDPWDIINGAGESYIYADCTTNPGGGETPRVLVHCNP